MSKTKQGGSSRLGRDSASQRLGIKAYDGETVSTGDIIIRQRGTHYLPGKNTKKGSDDTIYAMTDGKVSFFLKAKKHFNGTSKTSKMVSVEPSKSK